MHLLRGREAILGSKSILGELAIISDQPGVLDDLAYFLSTPDARKKSPLLALVPSSVAGSDQESVQGYSGAMLLFEYRFFGLGSRLYATADTTGRRALIAPKKYRARSTAYICRQMINRGAQIVLASIHQPGEHSFVHAEVSRELETKDQRGRSSQGRWSLTMRENPLYLPLAESFDETLARIGKKTRTNLRYYRRRAEKELGSSFVANARISLEEFVQFNRECSFAVPDDVARWRYESLGVIDDPFLHGVRDRSGRWLSLASGRRTRDQSVLEWQCNRADLPAASLSTVMRSYLIDHEIDMGMKRLYFEGGTPSSLQQSFVVEEAADLTLCSTSAYAWLARKLAGRIFPPKNYMAQMLTDEKLGWTRF